AVYKEVNEFYVDDINPGTFMKTGLDAMLESLDPYTNYISEDEIEDYRTMTTGKYGGIGAVIGKRNDKTTILMPYEGFPAHTSGLKIGDEILTIDGIDAASKNTNDVSKLLKGQQGTKVKVTVKRFGIERPLEFELTRQQIKIDNIPYSGMVTDQVGYIHLTDFTENASGDVREAVEKLKGKGMKYLIFDLRDNPGGLLKEAIDISNLFIPKDKLVVSTKGKATEWNKEYKSHNPPLDLDIPIAVLISGKSASASEIVSGTLQDYDRAVLVGQRSFGKGLVQTTRPLIHGTQVKITCAKYYIPSGRCIQAIDYSHKNEDGSAVKIADTLRKEFKTVNKARSVYDGGGVEPDFKVERKETPAIVVSLSQKGHLFDYATLYVSKHPTIAAAKTFALTDKEYQEFTAWLDGKEYDYQNKIQKNLEELSENAKKEKYFEDIKHQLEQLHSKIDNNKAVDLQKFKDELKEALEKEIVSRYYLQKGIIEASFDSDQEIQEALGLFKNMNKYNQALGKQ
ncbi:MAG TPA: S41 family peptidase, partial [Cytophagales bacterium]|nr:S41 family peptidase [Cytophagales bacterium]